jgi:hypothetical protein
VFEFFADAARLAKWWGPKGFSIPSIDKLRELLSEQRVRDGPRV